MRILKPKMPACDLIRDPNQKTRYDKPKLQQKLDDHSIIVLYKLVGVFENCDCFVGKTIRVEQLWSSSRSISKANDVHFGSSQNFGRSVMLSKDISVRPV